MGDDFMLKIDQKIVGYKVVDKTEEDELVNIFEEVLDSWQAGESIEEAKQIYDKARQMLPKDRD
jgi:hypothetical protein